MTKNPTLINGINPDQIRQTAASATDAAAAAATFSADTTWEGGFQSTSRFDTWSFGGQAIPRDASLTLATPKEMGGSATLPTPLEAYLASLNGCLVVGLVLQCSLRGIEIKSLKVHTTGTVDARAFLVNAPIPAGFPAVKCEFLIEADADEATLREMLDAAMATSPNKANVTTAVPLEVEYTISKALAVAGSAS